MSAPPKITERIIKSRVGEANLAKGEPYARRGAVFDTKRQGLTLRGRVQGRTAEPYRVSVTCDAKGIVSAECSCPVGGGGYCKHVAALLLVWRQDPQAFLEVEDLEASLARRSKEELLALVRQMLRRAPELEILLETPLPGSAKARQGPVSPDIYRRQAQTAFRLAGDDWRASYGVAADLMGIKALGDDFLEQDNVAAAVAVYDGLIAAIIEGYGSIQDEEGAIAEVAGACAERLGHCLDREQDPSRRSAILQAMFALYRFDIEIGGIGIGDEVPGLVVEHATADEKRLVASWVREALPKGQDKKREWSDNYRLRVYGGFLLDLEADQLDDEGYLRVCRETGRTLDVVDKLLELGRLAEARAEAEPVRPFELIPFADLFVSHGAGEVAEELIRERSRQAKGQDVSLLEWLKRRAIARRDKVVVLDLTRAIFRLRPNLEGYKALRKLSGKAHWDDLRAALLAELETRRDGYLLVEIALDEGDIDRAVELVQPGSKFATSGMELQVAHAAEAKRPRAALELYRRHAESRILAQGRANYQEACRHLRKVRDLYRKLKDEPGWTGYRDDLRDRFRRFRAFQEELASAKL
jgi:hypothetical protein